MNKALAHRVNKIMEYMGDITDPVEAFKAKAAAMSNEELKAARRKIMLENGYDPSLPHDEALAKYVEKLEADATPENQETITQLVELIKCHPEGVAKLFDKPESTTLS
jgi:hypothetical protein